MKNRAVSPKLKGLPKDWVRDKPWLDEYAIMICYRGSITHGTYRPSSEPNSVDDKDVMSIVVPPLDHYFGLKQWGSRGTRELMHEEWDIVGYEVRKYIGLLAKGNPNVLGTLWLRPEHYLKTTWPFDMIKAERSLFVGKWVYRSFTGYAHSQLSRMERMNFEGYMGEKRKALVEKYGYDTKNASHLVRLLRMGIEFLTDGELHVTRHDAQELLDIKNGLWTIERVKEEAERLFENAQLAYIHSDLPSDIDSMAVNRLCEDVVYQVFNDREKNER